MMAGRPISSSAHGGLGHGCGSCSVLAVGFAGSGFSSASSLELVERRPRADARRGRLRTRATCGSVLDLGGIDEAERGFLQPDAVHRLAEQLAVLGLVDGLGASRRSSRRRTLQHAHFFSDSAVLSAVWPPMVGSSASGRSFSMILATTSGVIGSI
jgi:hypothetical protein